MEGYAGQQYVGIDLHRRRSVIVRTAAAGEVLECTRIINDVDSLATVMARAGESPEVVLEATYGWYWAADALAELGATVHLAHPLGVKAFEYRRVKKTCATPPIWRTCCGWVGYLRRGSPRRPRGSCGSWCGTGDNAFQVAGSDEDLPLSVFLLDVGPRTLLGTPRRVRTAGPVVVEVLAEALHPRGMDSDEPGLVPHVDAEGDDIEVDEPGR